MRHLTAHRRTPMAPRRMAQRPVAPLRLLLQRAILHRQRPRALKCRQVLPKELEVADLKCQPVLPKKLALEVALKWQKRQSKWPARKGTLREHRALAPKKGCPLLRAARVHRERRRPALAPKLQANLRVAVPMLQQVLRAPKDRAALKVLKELEGPRERMPLHLAPELREQKEEQEEDHRVRRPQAARAKSRRRRRVTPEWSRRMATKAAL